jgi:DNA repair exonuclease SbcCD ATPase subunit
MRESDIQDQYLQHQEDMQQLHQALAQKDEELRQQKEQGQLLEKSLAQRSQENAIQQKQSQGQERKETRSLCESLKELQMTLSKKEEEILELREAQQRKNVGAFPPSYRTSPVEESSSKLDSLEPTLQQDLERLQVALRQTEAREIEWREKARDLSQSLAQSKASINSLQEIAMFLQASVLERESAQQRLQVSHSRGSKSQEQSPSG